MSLSIYVLSCSDNKYYVGKTKNLDARIKSHFYSYPDVVWLKLYKPVKLLQVYADQTSFDEDKFTIQYMSEYGIDNVRGGSFTTVNLSKEEKNVIEKMIIGSTDCCYKCKKKGHFAKDCKYIPQAISIKSTNKDCKYKISLYDILEDLWDFCR